MEIPKNTGESRLQEWFNDKNLALSDQFIAADLAHAEALDDGDSATRFRTERMMGVIQERQLHLHELLSMANSSETLRLHRELLATRLSAHNNLSSQLAEHIDLVGSFKAGTEAEKLRAKLTDTDELLSTIDT